MFERKFTSPDVHPYDTINWEHRVSIIQTEKGEIVNEQKDVEVPDFWSQLATDILVSKYFRRAGVPETGNEVSAKQVIDRVVKTIRQAGEEFGGYFATTDDAETFEAELTYLIVNQMGAFNSPTFFNCGLFHQYGIIDDGGNWYWSQEDEQVTQTTNNFEYMQASACFIQAIEDDLMAIFDLVKQEAKIFKYGSGSGTNFSTLRASGEKLSSGGTSSGVMSFLKVFDSAAGATKSAGTTRRAAKMICLDIDHPEVVDFIEWKVNEEKKVAALVAAGYSAHFDGEAYQTVSGQNSNNSIRIPDEFMEAYLTDGDWSTTLRTTGEVHETFSAKELMSKISEAAWSCADPGVQFDTTINKWHTCANTARINASNPCAEFLFIDDSACNLASLNLVKFLEADKSFDVASFRYACKIFVTAQEILVDLASYPTKKIAQNSHEFRPLGLGFANIGGLLMRCGLPYDSNEGRAIASAISAIMTGTAYNTSAEIAQIKGTFNSFKTNKAVILKVMKRHRDAVSGLDACPQYLLDYATTEWDNVLVNGNKFGFRNAQTTLLAPTGTIGLLMDCDTTGIEPDFALVKFKKLTGGGRFKIVNQSVREALKTLGYLPNQINQIVDYAQSNEKTLEDAPYLKAEHLPVFDCASPSGESRRCISPQGHIKMMAAVQPFISGAISKTVNVPNETTVDQIEQIYVDSWKLGLKSIALYRDGSKLSQPLIASDEQLTRIRLPDERRSITHKFSVAGHEGYMTVGLYENGKPGELFLTMSKTGSVISGLMDTVATFTSISLQYGVPLEVLVSKFSHVRFEPSGFTNNQQIPIAKSIIDYVFRWLGLKFLHQEGKQTAIDLSLKGLENGQLDFEENKAVMKLETMIAEAQADAPPCHVCESIMIRSGTCYKCLNCGATSGCS